MTLITHTIAEKYKFCFVKPKMGARMVVKWSALGVVLDILQQSSSLMNAAFIPKKKFPVIHSIVIKIKYLNIMMLTTHNLIRTSRQGK